MKIATIALTIGTCTYLLPFHVSARSYPPGFFEMENDGGIVVAIKGKEVMQMVDLKEGASVELLHGNVIPSDGEGTNFKRIDIREWWKEWSAKTPRAFSLLNSQFFNMNNPLKSPIAFSVKMNGVVYTGYGDKSEYPGRKRMLLLAKDVQVKDYNDDPGSLYREAEKNIIVGLKPDVSKQGNSRRARTFMAKSRDGRVLIFTTPGSTQRYAERMLQAFGASKNDILMLDGGGSTQYIQEGMLKIPVRNVENLRGVPLAIGLLKK